MKRIFAFILVLSLIAALTGCAEKVISVGDGSTLNGVTVEVASCQANTEKDGLNDQYPCTYFQIEASITNNSSDEVAKICYDLDVLDKDGNILYTFESLGYTMRANPLAPGESTIFNITPQRVLDGAPASVQLTLTSTFTADELPEIHIPEPGEDLAAAKDNEHLKNMDQDPPVQINIYIDHGGPAETAELTDSEDIAEFISYFSEVRIDGETNEVVTDNYNSFSLTFSDGETVSFSLNRQNLEFSADGYHIFTLSGFENLWNYMNSVAEFPEE